MKEDKGDYEKYKDWVSVTMLMPEDAYDKLKSIADEEGKVIGEVVAEFLDAETEDGEIMEDDEDVQDDETSDALAELKAEVESLKATMAEVEKLKQEALEDVPEDTSEVLKSTKIVDEPAVEEGADESPVLETEGTEDVVKDSVVIDPMAEDTEEELDPEDKEFIRDYLDDDPVEPVTRDTVKEQEEKDDDMTEAVEASA